jgi:hypothetical protein
MLAMFENPSEMALRLQPKVSARGLTKRPKVPATRMGPAARASC